MGEKIEVDSKQGAFAESCYQHPYLTRAVFRVDFLNFVERIGSKELEPSVLKVIGARFPIPEPRPTVESETEIRGEEIKQKQQKYTSWVFHGKNREKLVSVTPKYLTVERIRYSTYEDVKGDFAAVFAAFTEAYSEAVINRLGVRYINEITLTEGRPTEWDEYLDKRLISAFGFFADREKLSRLFSVAELNYGDLQLRFQFGMHNPDYPAVIRRRVFVLDLDAYAIGVVEPKAVGSVIDEAHARIQKLFESSITEKLREKMNEQSGAAA
jgi:uncharacterized protein (TIGR04255 family)